MTPPEPVTQLFDVPQVAVIYGKGERWVRDQVNAGRMPFTRIGRSVRFTEQNVRDYIEASSQAPAVAKHSSGRVTRRRK